jgi:hypothetical protein
MNRWQHIIDIGDKVRSNAKYNELHSPITGIVTGFAGVYVILDTGDKIPGISLKLVDFKPDILKRLRDVW